MIKLNYASRTSFLPPVKTLVEIGEKLPFCEQIQLNPPEELISMVNTFISSFGEFFVLNKYCDKTKDIISTRFVYSKNFSREGYGIKIDKDIEIGYSSENGAFYALITLRQMLLNGVLYKCNITDQPMIGLRGYMLDVSRGKMPTLETLKTLVDTLASFKYNHFELYFEGSPFIYPGYEKFANPEAYTAQDMVDLSEYCNKRFIDLTPNLNTLGHMSPWLAHKEFNHLSESSDGFEMMGLKFPPTTLDCQNPESFDFVLSLIDGILPCFKSDYINVGLDEPFELGKGKNAEEFNATGIDKMYLQYVKNLYSKLKIRDKKMLMWGDVATRNEKIIEELPDDIIFLEWGYQAEYPFDKRAKSLSDINKKFILCPGTSSWHSYGGVTDNMLNNVYNASQAAHKYNAFGIMLTDWGDGGHIQYPFVSFPALLFTAAMSWSDICNESLLAQALNKFVFRDDTSVLGTLVLDLGRYVNFEERRLECKTLATIPLEFPSTRGKRYLDIENGLIKLSLLLLPKDLQAIYKEKMSARSTFESLKFSNFINDLLLRFKNAAPKCADAETLMSEVYNTISLVNVLEQARLTLSEEVGDKYLAINIKNIAAEHIRLWKMRNRMFGLEIGLNKLKRLAENLENE